MREHVVLDNPVWNALGSRQRDMAQCNGAARRYDREVTPLVGLERTDVAAFADLRAMVEPAEVVGLVRAAPYSVPQGWTVMREITIDQMICDAVPGATDIELIALGLADAPEMLDLAKATEPGPFRAGTVRMGRYRGIRDADGRLMAMAGERMRLDAFTEISGVCTWPEFRGRGLAKALVSALAVEIANEGRTPFLHVKTDNAARLLYEKLGFRVRTQVHFKVIAAA